jgi:hypothetical protein
MAVEKKRRKKLKKTKNFIFSNNLKKQQQMDEQQRPDIFLYLDRKEFIFSLLHLALSFCCHFKKAHLKKEKEQPKKKTIDDLV